MNAITTDVTATNAIGVDGGQSGLRLRVAGQDRWYEAPGYSHAEGDVVSYVVDATTEAWRRAGRPAVGRIVLGLSMAPHTTGLRDDLCRAVGAAVGAREVWLCDDRVTGHAGAFPTTDGIALIVGTGVACLGVNRATGRTHAVDGGGYLLGDDGGAFRIGQAGVAAVLRALDGRGPDTALTALAGAAFGGLDELAVALHLSDRPVNTVAHFAVEVLRVARAGDPVATRIVDAAADELATTALAAVDRTGVTAVAAAGRLFAAERDDNGDGLLLGRLRDRLAARDPRVTLAPAGGTPLDGACALAAADGPGPYADLIHRVDTAGTDRAALVPPARAYLDNAIGLLRTVVDVELPAIARAAALVADAIAGGRTVHVFGSGHSHIIAEELFYRAGGLANINPILVSSLMLHGGAALSTKLERLTGVAQAVLDDHDVVAGDVLLIASNSGGNAVCREMAQLARERGVAVIALTSLTHASSAPARPGVDVRLHQLADVVLDNHGRVGDASLDIDGFDRPVGATSTVVGAAIVTALVADTVAALQARGVRPEVFASSNTPGGDAVNAGLIGRHRGKVRSL
jgi:uncharacterized phosphosugar-binding protein/N-acetylglucosamine kinase-like BadF-type ATPase